MIQPAWYRWAQARQGVVEIVGPTHNQDVVNFWKLGKVALNVTDDETPWCAAFANAALEQTGYPGTKSGRARSFMPSAHFVACDTRLGAVVVLSSPGRGDESGHVGFLHAVSATQFHLLGGNQGNRVCIAAFPKSRLLHLLWPSSAPEYKLFPDAFKSSTGKETTDR